MYTDLYSYLILHKNLPVPGIGTFLLERHAAIADFPNKRFLPPSYSIKMEKEVKSVPTSFFKWLSHQLSISNHEAVTKFNDFAFDMKKQITTGAEINWENVGRISSSLSSEINFVPGELIVIEEPVAAEKIIRIKAEHSVRVGEDERTSEEMTVMLNQETEQKTNWWAGALVLAILSLIFLGWHFSQNGVKISSTANSTKTTPIESSSSYKLMP